VGNLQELGRDDDSGGFFSSEVRFNAQQGATYFINIKGFKGAAGHIVVSFRLNATTARVPVITTAPAGQTVAAGAQVTFTVAAQGTALSYQWLFNGAAIAGATTTTLTVNNVQEANAGRYAVRVTSGTGVTAVPIESIPAILQIGAPNIAAQDKFRNSPALGAGGAQLASLDGDIAKNAGGSVSRGYSGSQVFNTFGATKEQGEPNHADEIGGASQWFTYQAPTTGVLKVSTEGSDFDTVLAIYTANARRKCNRHPVGRSISFQRLPVGPRHAAPPLHRLAHR
jgi:hypothetical protein